MVNFKIGPNRTDLQPFTPNRDDRPFYVDSPNFTGNVLVRVQRYSSPQCRDAPHSSPYFSKRRRNYAIVFQGRFKPTNTASNDGKWSAQDVYCWIEMERPLRLPPKIMTRTGLAFIHFFDPLFVTEGITKQQPYAGTPVFATFNVIRVDPAPTPQNTTEGDAASVNSDENFGSPSLVPKSTSSPPLDTHTNIPSPALSTDSASSVDPTELEANRQMSEEALIAAADEIGITPSQIITLGRKYHEEEALQSPVIDPAQRPNVSTPQLLELPPPAAPASPIPALLYPDELSPSLKPSSRDASLSPLSLNAEPLVAPRPRPLDRPWLTASAPTTQRGSPSPRPLNVPSPSPATPSRTAALELPHWPYSSHNFDFEEDLGGTIPSAVDTVKKRRKHFASEAVRKNYVLEPDRVYTCEMYDSYIDMNKLSINVGFDIGGRSLFGDKQKIRITFADAGRRNVFFVIYLDPELD